MLELIFRKSISGFERNKFLMTDFITYIISSMVKYTLFSLPFFIIFRGIVFIKRRRINIWHEVGLFVFIIAISAIIPIAIIIPNEAFQKSEFEYSQFNFVPGLIIRDTIKDITQKGEWYSFTVSIIGNIVGFMPFGFFTSLLWRGASLKKALIVGFTVSLFIEIYQIFLPRVTDIDDLILNTIGAMLGYFVWKLLSRIVNLKRFYINQT